MQLTIEERQTADGKAVIALRGRLLLGPEGAELESTVQRFLNQGVRKFLFDFSELTHIDSTGIGRCISSLNMIMALRGALVICGAGGQVREGFRVTRLDTVFRFVDDPGTGEAALG